MCTKVLIMSNNSLIRFYGTGPECTCNACRTLPCECKCLQGMVEWGLGWAGPSRRSPGAGSKCQRGNKGRRAFFSRCQPHGAGYPGLVPAGLSTSVRWVPPPYKCRHKRLQAVPSLYFWQTKTVWKNLDCWGSRLTLSLTHFSYFMSQSASFGCLK